MFVAWRDLRFAKGRFGLMLAVVVLITVLVGLLSGLTAGLGRESTSAVTGLQTERLVFAGKTASFTNSRIPLPSKVDGDPMGFATTRATDGDKTAPVTVIGVQKGSGVAPDAAGVDAGKVVLAQAAAEDLGVETGGMVKLAGEEFEVAAVQGDASFAHTPVAWLTLQDWQQVTGSGQSATVIATDAAEAPAGFVNVSRSDARDAIGSYASENGSLRLIRGFLLAISALVIGAFFTVWTIQRTRDIAVLKALGASTKYLLRDAVGQAAVLLLGGTAVGAAVVIAAGQVAEGRVPFELTAADLGLPLLMLNLLGLVGAFLAVRRVTSIDPLTALGSAR